MSKDDKSAIVRLERVRIWQNSRPDEEAGDSLVAGADDKVFRLDRVDGARMRFAGDRPQGTGGTQAQIAGAPEAHRATFKMEDAHAPTQHVVGRGLCPGRRLRRLARQRRHRSRAAAKLKVVYHLSDLDKVSFVLGNIENHLDGVGGPDHVTIALVIHGQALRAFHAASANPDLKGRVGRFSKAGLELAACGNTMKSQKVELKDLLPGFVSADRGGVVRIAELQSQGYLYLRP